MSSFYGDVNAQVDAVCAELAATPQVGGTRARSYTRTVCVTHARTRAHAHSTHAPPPCRRRFFFFCVPQLVAAGGYNAVGFSQGGQFLRALVERCQHKAGPKAATLVTLGAQHMGVQNAPGCRCANVLTLVVHV